MPLDRAVTLAPNNTICTSLYDLWWLSSTTLYPSKVISANKNSLMVQINYMGFGTGNIWVEGNLTFTLDAILILEIYGTCTCDFIPAV